jgi:hypothetical protein
MNRLQLEHVIRAAATISEDDEIVVIGSQAILGRYPDALEELCLSADADLNYVRTALCHGLVSRETLLERLDQTALDGEQTERLRKLIETDGADAA